MQFGCPGRTQGKSRQANPSHFSTLYDLPTFLQTFPDIHAGSQEQEHARRRTGALTSMCQRGVGLFRLPLLAVAVLPLLQAGEATRSILAMYVPPGEGAGP